MSTKVGGIIENYTQSYTGNSKNFTVFLPYINIQYTPSQKFNIVVKYHSAAEYPTINQLNPFKITTDSLMNSVGNPALKTGVNQTLSMNINIMNFITLTPYYSFNNSQMTSYISIDPGIKKHFTNQTINADNFTCVGANFDITIPIGKRIFWKNGINWNQSNIAYHGESNKTGNLTINTNLVYVHREKGLVAGFVLQKQTVRDLTIQGYNTNGNDLLLALVRKSFLKEKLNIGFYYLLPWNWGLTYNLPNETTAPAYYQMSHTGLNFIKNLVFMEFNYRFSTGKDVKKNQVSSDSEFEQKRKSGFGL
jgi:hypothetical protein